MPFYKYRTDLGNTVTAKSSTSFTGMTGNEAQISSSIDTPQSQPLYLYKVSGGLLVDNDDDTINNALAAEGVQINASPTWEQFTGYTATTTTELTNKLDVSAFNTYTGSTSGTVTANNGLTKSGSNIHLGGTLTGATKIGLGGNNFTFTATTGTLRYGSDLSASYNVRSLVDRGYVTGITSTLLTTSAFNTYSGNTVTLINTKIGSANNGLTKSGTNVKLGGSLTGNTNIGLNTFNLQVTGASGQFIVGSSRFSILNPANTFRYDFIGSAIAATRTVTLPLLTANDTLVTAAFIQTLTNKTLTTPTLTSPVINTQITGTVTSGGTITPTNYIIAATAAQFLSNKTLVSPVFRTGAAYQTDYSGTYTVRSIVDKGFVTGITSTLVTQAKINTYTGTTAPATYQSKSSIVILTGTTLPATYQSKASINTYTGTTAPNQFAAKSAFLTYTGTTAPNQFADKTNFNFYTGTTVPVTYLAISAFNTYTGSTSGIATANNGLTKSGSNVHLGGALTGATQLGLGSNNFTFTATTGTLRYGSDLSASYNVRSLVDKGYVTGITSTLLTTSAFNTYSGNTATLINAKLATSAFNIYSGNTATLINSKLATTAFNTYSGTTVPLTYQSKASIVTLTGTTLPATYQSKTSINTYTGTTAPAQFASKSAFLTYTGTTAPLTYQSKSSIVTLTGTTLPATYQSKSSINTYTGTTAPNQFAAKTNFNTYTGTTAPATYLTKTAFNTYTGSSAGISTANNGLTKSGLNVRLGGSLTGNTTITTATGSRLTIAGWPIMYATDLSGSYSVRSVVDKGFVTGITSTLLTTSAFNTYSGNTANLINTKLATSAFNTYSANTVTYANNGLTRSGANVHLGGTLTGNTTFVTATGSRLTVSGWPLMYATDLSGSYSIRSVVDRGYVTGITSTLLTTSAFNTYSGNSVTYANNGLTRSGSRVKLGGALTGATQIGLGANNITFTATTGTLRYGSDLSANYNVRSLVDKGYVTGTTQGVITFKENGTNLNTPPTQFTTINFTSGTTAIDKGSNILEIQTIHGSEVLNTGRTTTQTNGTATFVDYLAHGFILAGGTYKVEYTCKASIGTANTNLGVQLLIDGSALESGTNNLYRIPNANARIMVSTFKIISLSAGSHSFRLQFSASSGTATAEYGWILITRIS